MNDCGYSCGHWNDHCDWVMGYEMHCCIGCDLLNVTVVSADCENCIYPDWLIEIASQDCDFANASVGSDYVNDGVIPDDVGYEIVTLIG